MSKLFKHAFASMTAGSFAFVSSAAVAQSAADAAVDNFTRNRNTSVQQRSRPDYDAPGLRAGAFMVYPRLEVQAEHNSNIYATATNEVDDTIFHVRPELSIESGWSQNSLSAYVRGSLNRYVDNDSENVDEFSTGGNGRIDVARLTSIGFGGNFTSSFEPRTAPDAAANAVEATKLDTAQAYVSGTRSAGYLKVSGRADWRSYNYQDGMTLAGTLIEQDTRDRDVVSASGRVDLAISPDTAFFVQATGNERSYDLASTALAPNRNSTGAEYLLGANFEVSALVRGEVAVGYYEQDFDEIIYDDTSGYAARAQMEWFPSGLTTVNLAVGRTVEDSATPGVGAFVSTNLSLGLDHELLRNVILNLRTGWGEDAYEGIDRDDRRLTASLGATYLINRRLGVNATVSTLDTQSKGANRDSDFTVNKLAISLVTQF